MFARIRALPSTSGLSLSLILAAFCRILPPSAAFRAHLIHSQWMDHMHIGKSWTFFPFLAFPPFSLPDKQAIIPLFLFPSDISENA
jgi:hypothetical protein